MIFGNKIVNFNEFTIDFSFSYLFIGTYWTHQARVSPTGNIKNRYLVIKICVIPFIALNLVFEYQYLNNTDSIQNISEF